MKKITWIALALAACALAGCQNTPDTVADGDEPAAASEAEIAVNAAGTSGIDTSRLFELAGADLRRPERAFVPYTALDNAHLGRVLLGGDKLSPAGVLGRQSLWESGDFRVQKSEAWGEMYLRLKEEKWAPAAPESLDEGALAKRSLAVLRDLGIPEAETGAVMQRQIARNDAESKKSEIHQHLTIVDRAFNGIPVRGSRAVVVYDLAGNMNHVMLHWRPIAPEGTAGEQWGTRMRVAEIVARAAERLEVLGLGERPARLSYQYVPVEGGRAQGAAAFALRCVAMVDVNREDPQQQRPVEIDIELD